MNEEEQQEANKNRDAAKNKALHSIGFRAIGQDPQTGELNGGKTGDTSYGKVRIWHLKEKKFIELWPVDASEALAGGGCVLDKPEDEQEKEA